MARSGTVFDTMSEIMLFTFVILLTCAANAQSLPPGKGKTIVARSCASCHSLKVVTSKRASKEQWATLVDQMISRGADVSDDEIDPLIEYLSRNFSSAKKSVTVDRGTARLQKVNVNKASISELTKELGLSKQDAAAIVACREKNGNFGGWDALMKVPGLDTTKLQKNRARLTF